MYYTYTNNCVCFRLNSLRDSLLTLVYIVGARIHYLQNFQVHNTDCQPKRKWSAFRCEFKLSIPCINVHKCIHIYHNNMYNICKDEVVEDEFRLPRNCAYGAYRRIFYENKAVLSLIILYLIGNVAVQ